MEQIPYEAPQPMSLNLQRIAWAVVLVGFVLFCGLCAFSVYGLYSFFFQSTVPMTVIAQASRGSIGITGTDLREDVERGSRALALANTVRPNDQESQGIIVIQDPYLQNSFVASLTLIGDSSAAIRAALRPRFEWGGAGYVVQVSRVSGSLEVTIAQDLPRGLEFELSTERRARVRLTDPGWYSIDMSSDSITVYSHGGTALIYGTDKSVGYSVTSNSGSVYSIADDDLRAVSPSVNLLVNSEFYDVLPQSERLETVAPLNWACSHTPNPPRDVFTVDHQDGRNVLRMTRGDGATSNGETTCTQGLAIGETWQDISEYDSLSIRASMYLNFQSLAVCGFEGSECPLMLRLDYINADGVKGELLYGFYAVPGPADPYDLTCPSCRQPHIRLQEKTWYSFESGNLLAGFPSDSRPVAISRLRFYASGHEYDVRVSRIALIAQSDGG
ncbi:MAG: hypothetical protein IPK52_01255 [Chloroflexi bacterium]|nr:hypothetical protein [Chloroflexota bacterium]